MSKARVLFVCVHNSARSQMAEAWCNALFGNILEAESAGLEPGTLNLLAVRAMHEVGIDISHKQPRGVFELYRAGKLYAYVITVCDETSAERCPIFPGFTKRLHWSFPDPASFTGTDEEKMSGAREVRDQIRQALESWAEEVRIELLGSEPRTGKQES